MEILGALKFLAAYGEAGIAIVLVVAILLVAKFCYKEIKRLTEDHKEGIRELTKDHKEDMFSHKKDYEDVVKEMFDVVNKNTESNTKLSEAVRELSAAQRYHQSNHNN